MVAMAYFCAAMQKPPGRPSKGKKKPTGKRNAGPGDKPVFRPGGAERRGRPAKPRPISDPNGPIRLNRYIANSGVCSRREADVLIESGAVRVNGDIVTELGTRVTATDHVQVGDHRIKPETKRYYLVNKPKGFAAAPIDPSGKRTIGDLISKVCRETLLPVGKLEPEATGLVLMTNDPDLTARLTHLVTGLRQLWHVECKGKITSEQVEMLKTGVQVDGKMVRAEAAEIDVKNPHAVGIDLRSQRSRIARRLLESMGHTVVKVDRVRMGPLTKKDLPRGHFRPLEPAELNLLRMSS